jgi:hypothetical protein
MHARRGCNGFHVVARPRGFVDGEPMQAQPFGAKLELVLKALSTTRGRLAADLAVDKSLIGRWISGAVTPSAHNLARLTQYVAARRPGFTMLDWEGDIAALSARLGVGGDAGEAGALFGGLLPDTVMTEALTLTALRGADYEGFWRTTRLSIELPGRFVHDPLMIRREANGLLSLRIGVEDMRFIGWTFPTQTQLFSFATDAATGVFIFSIFNAVMRNRADRLDGLTMTLQRAGGGSPVAEACLLERVGSLSGDAAADEAAFEASVPPTPIVEEAEIDPVIRARLYRDVGPEAVARGGAAMLSMSFADSLSRGPPSVAKRDH